MYARLAARLSTRLTQATEALLALLMAALVLVVWIGVIDRYHFHWQLPWPEVMARYLMIWAALLAVSSAISRREHIGLTALLLALPAPLRHLLLIAMDLLALALFLYLFCYGLPFAASGANRQAMILGATLQPFYAAIPAAALLCSIQLLLVMLRDHGTHLDRSSPEAGQ